MILLLKWMSPVLQWLNTKTTVVLRPFSLLTQRLAGSSTQQPPPPLPIPYIFPFQPALSHVPFHHLAPSHPWPSPSSLTFHLEQRDLFHSIILLQHVPTILTYSISRCQTLTQSPFFPSALHSALYPLVIHHTFISPSSSPYVPISHSASPSWLTFHFHIP